MGQVSAVLRSTSDGFSHWCPGCNEMHAFQVPRWSFNGNVEKPTFAPSMKITGKQRVTNERGEWIGEWVRDANGNAVDRCCHYILTDGVINFCPDSTHALADQKVPLPPLPHWLSDEA